MSKWTDERVQQYIILEMLVNMTESLDNGSNFFERCRTVIVLAKELKKNDVCNGELSFMNFLNQQIKEDRSKQ